MKTIAVLVEEQYQVLEVWYPYLFLRSCGYTTVLVGTGSKDVYQSKEGYPANIDIAVQNIKPEEYDGVVVPGGYAPDKLRRFPAVLDLVIYLNQAEKLVAAICHGPWVLISAGILKGRRVTCFEAIKDDVINAGAHYHDQEVVRDDNLITSRNPYDLPAFCNAIENWLEKEG